MTALWKSVELGAIA